MRLRLAAAGCMDDWFVLEGGVNWACVEGDAEEWTAIADALDAGEARGFKRCATRPDGDDVTFWSPRNAYQDRDIVRVPKTDAPELAKHIRAVLAVYAAGPSNTGGGR